MKCLAVFLATHLMGLVSAFRFEPFQPTTVEFTASNETISTGDIVTLTCVVTNPIPGMAGYISFFKYDPHYDEFIEFAVNGILTMNLPRFTTTIVKTPSVHFTQYNTTLVINSTIVEDSGHYVCGSMVYNIYADLDLSVEAVPPSQGPTFDFTKDIALPWVGDTIIMYCKARNLLPGHYISIQKYSPSLGEFTDIPMESGRYQIEFYSADDMSPIQASDSTPDRVNWVPAANRPPPLQPLPTEAPPSEAPPTAPAQPDVPVPQPDVPSGQGAQSNIPVPNPLPNIPNVNVPGVLDVPNFVPNLVPGAPSQGGQPSQGAPVQGQPPSPGAQGFPNQGQPSQPGQGFPNQGQPVQPSQGAPGQGFPNQGQPSQPGQGFQNQGLPNQGFPNQGYPNQGAPSQNYPNQGLPSNQGIPNQGNSYQPPTQYHPNQYGSPVRRRFYRSLFRKQYPQAGPSPGASDASDAVPPSEATSEALTHMPLEFNLKFIIFDAQPQDSGVYHCGAPGAGVFDTLVLNVG